MAVVEARDLVREYQMGQETVRALDGASLSIDGGQFVSVVGPSGAGKSTLLHVIGALDTPTSGSIVVDGTDLASLSDDAASTFRRNRVGFIFQFFNLVPTLSAWENVALPMLLDSRSLRKAKPRAVELMERVGLGHRIDHRPSELSGGQMQRVAIARSLIMDPKILLADEPTGNLDSKTGEDVLALLADVAHDDPNRLVLMVTHDPGAAAVCDRVITVRDGKVVVPPTELVPPAGPISPAEPVEASGTRRIPPAELVEAFGAAGLFPPNPSTLRRAQGEPASFVGSSGSGGASGTSRPTPRPPAEPVEASAATGPQRRTAGRRRMDDDDAPTQRLSVADLMALGVSGQRASGQGTPGRPAARQAAELTDTGRHRSVR